MISRIVLAVGVTLIAGNLRSAYAQDNSSPWPKPALLGADIPAYKPLADEESAGVATPSGELRTVFLRDALKLALANNPNLAVRGWEVRAAEGRIQQADVLPNPELGIELENFGGSAERQGFDGAEATLQLSQLVELGGKRAKRRKKAQAEQAVSGWDYEVSRLEVYTITTKAFFNVLVAQRLVALKQGQLELAASVLETVQERVAAGRVTTLEETKAKVEESSSRIALQHARRELDAARTELVAAWGGSPPTFGTAEGNLDLLDALPPIENILQLIADSPEVRRWDAEQLLRQSALTLEQAQQVPDLTISAGVRRYQESDDNAFIAGISIPLPIFGLNRGAVREAETRLPQGFAQKEAAIVQAARSARQTYNELSAVHLEVQSLVEVILPGAKQAYEAAQTAYREGQIGLLDVLDAQRTLFEARTRHADALGAYHNAKADLERIIGRSLTMADQPQR